MKVSLVRGSETERLINLEAEDEQDRRVLGELNTEGILTYVMKPADSPDVCALGGIFVTGRSDADVLFLERTLQYYYPMRELVG